MIRTTSPATQSELSVPPSSLPLSLPAGFRADQVNIVILSSYKSQRDETRAVTRPIKRDRIN